MYIFLFVIRKWHYGIDTVRANQKQMLSLEQDKQMKRGEHDRQVSNFVCHKMDDKQICHLVIQLP